MKKEAMLYEKLTGKAVHCFLCAHHCRIDEGSCGLCGVRKNSDGTLYTAVYGEIITANIKYARRRYAGEFSPPLSSYCIATVGCNFKCRFCENWQISQMSKREFWQKLGYEQSPDIIVKNALDNGCDSISYTYTEPTVFLEYAFDIAAAAKQKRLKNIFFTNGYMTKEAVGTILPVLDKAVVSLHSMNEGFYTDICGAKLGPVLETIRLMKTLGVHVEISTLLIPGRNDSTVELNRITKFISGISNDIPWHVSKFNPEFKYAGRQITHVSSIIKAVGLGRSNGLRNVHIGSMPVPAGNLI
jgi:pyruvate formate lyase activating enzyme